MGEGYEVMASRRFLESRPSLTASVRRSRSHPKPGAYPSAYGVAFDGARNVYEVTLMDFE